MSVVDKYHQIIQKEKVLLAYKGCIDGDTVTYLMKLAEQNIASINEKLIIRKKVISILVEAVQNIVNYFAEESLDKSFENESFVILSMQNNQYEIYVGNYVSRHRMRALKKRIDNVNMMSPEDLQKVYLDILENPKVSITRGAGLGLIDMARRTQNKINYLFAEHDQDYVLFMMNINIARVKDVVLS
ncbi:MAG: SiaB family protein kinase [Raineya sp.]|nr:SiaB family protein kinase [Raineya sp.]